MSRVELRAKNSRHEVVAGFDRPLNTFFIFVAEAQSANDLRDIPPIEFRDRWRPAEVIERIRRYAVAGHRTESVIRAIQDGIDPAGVVSEKLEAEGRLDVS